MGTRRIEVDPSDLVSRDGQATLQAYVVEGGRHSVAVEFLLMRRRAATS